MKTANKDKRSSRRAIALLAGLVVTGAIIVAVVLAFNKLRALWIEQCVIHDVNAQVDVVCGNHIKADAIRELFGLKNGANLALIDFAAKRDEAMAATPRIKSISVSRRLPDGITVNVTERTPFAKLNLRGSRKETGIVCDDEGVAFSCKRGAETLPVIRETPPGTKPGDRLEGRLRSALAVLRVLREPEFANITVTEVDASRPDFLLLTLASYKVVKFAWTGMDGSTPAADEALVSQLRCVTQAIATNLQPDTRVWNATQPGIVSADLYGSY